jgi:hypothetical protein
VVLLGWKGTATARDRVIGTVLDDVTESLPCVLAACWLPTTPGRIVLASGLEVSVDADVAVAAELARKLARASGLALVASSADGAPGELPPGMDVGIGDLRVAARPGDLVVMAAPQGREVVGATARHLAAERPDVNLVVVRAAKWSPHLEVGEVFAGP